MENITLDKLHQDLVALKQEMGKIKLIVEEDFDLSDDLVEEIEESRVRDEKDFVSHEEMREEFG